MRIESLSLQGFKSFAERSRLEFEGGITAIVGPNGSGKSNIVEALRWVTHTARARELRAQQAVDLIFHGSEAKNSLGFAEVIVQLNAPQHVLSRRLYRDGSNEQDLDGKRVRVRDIHAALCGTGLGQGALAVIGQGEVGEVVGANPQVLRGYLEEAAGLSQQTQHRSQTLDSIQESERNLAQLGLLLQELQSQVDYWAEQANRSREHMQLADQQSQLQAAVSYHKQQQLLQELSQLREQYLQAQQQSESSILALAEISQAIEHQRRSVQHAELGHAEYRSIQSQALAAERQYQDAQTLLRVLQQELEDKQLEYQSLPHSLPEQPAAEPVEALKEAEVQLKEAQKALKYAEDQRRMGEKQSHAAENYLMWQQEHQQLQTQILTEQELAAQLAEMVQHPPSEPDTSTIKQLRQQLQDVQQKHQSLLHRLAPMQREQQRLSQWLDSYQRYGEGSRNALKSNIAGILGSVADCLMVPERYEVAITAALGRRLEQVVVSKAEVARTLIGHLKKVGGRATFLPLDVLRIRPNREGAWLHEAGVLGWASDLCPSDPISLSQHVLGDTLIVQDDAVAVRLAQRYVQRPRLVSLAGEVLEASGALTGGQLRDQGLAHLSDLRRLQDLEDELSQLEQEILNTAQQLAALTPHIEQQQQQDQRQQQHYQQQMQSYRQNSQAYTACTTRLQSYQQQANRLAQKLDQPPPQPDLVALELQVELKIQALQQVSLQLDSLKQQSAQAQQAVLQWQHLQQQWQRAQTLEVASQRLAEQCQNQQQMVEQAQTQHQQIQSEFMRLQPPDIAPLEAEARELQQRYNQSSSALQQHRARAEQLQLQLARKESHELLAVPLPVVHIIGDIKQWQEQLSRSQQRLSQLGAVHPQAESEYQQVLQRYQQLDNEQQEARAAISDIQHALKTLDQDIALQFQQAYQRVAQAFSRYIQDLLGGQGEIKLVYNAQQVLQGLSLEVQPEGKRTRAMNLLSTGERTMIALAFLFSLAHAPQNAQGLPLAVLDEVDAPLDEANIRRFTQFLQRYAQQGSQFILVTHQKATMEVANALWGITSVRGLSRVFGIRAQDAEAFAKKHRS